MTKSKTHHVASQEVSLVRGLHCYILNQGRMEEEKKSIFASGAQFHNCHNSHEVIESQLYDTVDTQMFELHVAA